uniref:DUF7752 domain-containing protein n=1 Tax=Ditylenchus dipsaci TaxID=166011 RepID=A0A915DSD5_9BILA
MLDFCDDFIGGENRVEALHRYVKRHTNLDHLMFFCVEWAHKYNIFDNSCFGEQHLCLLIIQLVSSTLAVIPSTETVSGWSELVQILCAVFVSFLKFLGSREFKKVSILNLPSRTWGGELFRGREWAPLHQAALNTYHQLVFSGRLDCLPCPYTRAFPSTLTEIIEAPSFILEVPRRAFLLLKTTATQPKCCVSTPSAWVSPFGTTPTVIGFSCLLQQKKKKKVLMQRMQRKRNRKKKKTP